MSKSPRLLTSSLFFGASLSLLAGACTSDDGATGERTSHLSGRVAADGRAAAGIAIEAYDLGADGTLSTLTEVGATTDAGGRYQLDVALPETAVALVLRSDEAQPRAVIIADTTLAAAGDATVIAPPFDLDATVATDVAMRAFALGAGDLSLPSLALVLSPGLTAQLGAAADYQQAITTTATAAVAAEAALQAGLAIDLDRLGGASPAPGTTGTCGQSNDPQGDPSPNGLGDLLANAQLALAAALDLAVDDAGIADAYAVYVDAVITAHLALGCDPLQVELAVAAAVHVMTSGLASIEDVTAGHLAAVIAIATTSAIEAKLAVIAGTDHAAALRAGIALRATILGLTVALHLDLTAVNAALVTYQSAITASLYARLGLTADLVAGLTTDIDQAATVLALGLTDLGAHGNPNAIVAAHLQFYSAVASDAHVAVLTAARMTAADARATLLVLAQLELATR